MKTGEVYIIKPKYYEEYLGVKLILQDKRPDGWWNVECYKKDGEIIKNIRVEEDDLFEYYELKEN